MTQEELIYERAYRLQERLALLCEDREPTAAELNMAQQDVRDWEHDFFIRGHPGLKA